MELNQSTSIFNPPATQEHLPRNTIPCTFVLTPRPIPPNAQAALWSTITTGVTERATRTNIQAGHTSSTKMAR
ncbi:hypothetical protein PY793_10285 [Acetobacter fabarum]|uniref:hypothetical protein n=1 Tax=Acetobacter fabarum TaxID=483199 RepID=UPI00312B5D39